MFRKGETVPATRHATVERYERHLMWNSRWTKNTNKSIKHESRLKQTGVETSRIWFFTFKLQRTSQHVAKNEPH